MSGGGLYSSTVNSSVASTVFGVPWEFLGAVRTYDSWILQIEDEEAEIALLREAFTRAGILNPVRVARDGQQAIEYLAGEGRFSNRSIYPKPELALLDLNIPKVPGLEVLSWIRGQPSLNSLRVAVLSSSEDPADMESAYGLGISAYYVKPASMSERIRVAEEIKGLLLGRGDSPKSRPQRQKTGGPGFGWHPRVGGWRGEGR
jgi:CheY-like chemotaxis protein